MLKVYICRVKFRADGDDRQHDMPHWLRTSLKPKSIGAVCR